VHYIFTKGKPEKMDDLARRNEFVDQLKTSAKVSSDSALARALGVEKHKIAYWRSETGKIDTDLTIEFFRSETIDFLQSLVDDLRGAGAKQLAQKTAESAYYEQAGRSFERVLECLSNAKSIQSSAEFSEQEEKEVNKKQQGEGKDEERNKPISGTFSGQPDSRTAGQPDSRTAGQPDSRTACA
jgi:hypothetical protein